MIPKHDSYCVADVVMTKLQSCMPLFFTCGKHYANSEMFVVSLAFGLCE